MHGLLICDTAPHVPTQLEYLGAYTLGLLFHALDGFNHPLGGQGQEAAPKKFDISSVNCWSYSLPQLVHLICSGCISACFLILMI